MQRMQGMTYFPEAGGLPPKIGHYERLALSSSGFSEAIANYSMQTQTHDEQSVGTSGCYSIAAAKKLVRAVYPVLICSLSSNARRRDRNKDCQRLRNKDFTQGFRWYNMEKSAIFPMLFNWWYPEWISFASGVLEQGGWEHTSSSSCCQRVGKCRSDYCSILLQY